ncbi:hypothetical protein [Cupriavidus sp. Agwp_2]|uniref:hypothetical protein n=1 Tax=Cupriavidus sp. Agwp_2 TaxID=2897324 RepID=UPI00345F4F92
MLLKTLPWRLIGAAALGACLFAAGWAVNGWRKDAEIAELTAARAQADLTSANQALSDIQATGAAIRQHADYYLAVQSDLGAKMDAIRKDMKNARKPLPVDCRPDAQRVRGLSDAVDAAKQAAAAR